MKYEFGITGQTAVDVYPECGRLAMFFADEVPHEVRPTQVFFGLCIYNNFLYAM